MHYQYTPRARWLVLALAVLVVFAMGADTANANPPPEFEAETVESLLFAGDINADDYVESDAFVYVAPASTCKDSQGITGFDDDCPDVSWLCPVGVTDGALGRYARNHYDQLIAGYSTIDLMCLEGPIVPNPQLPTSVPATPLPEAPKLAFTGIEHDVTALGLILLGAGATVLAVSRRCLAMGSRR